MGLTQRDVTSSMLISLSGSGTVAPNFWMNWTNGINYNIGVQTPQYRIDSLDALLRTPISASNAPVTTRQAASAAATLPSALLRTARPRRTAIQAPRRAARNFSPTWYRFSVLTCQ